MQRIKKTLIYVTLLLTSLAILVSVSVQTPFVQKFIVEYIVDDASSRFGIDASIDHVHLKPFKGTLSIQGVDINKSNSVVKLDEIEVSGWEILKNWGEVKKAKLTGLEAFIDSEEELNDLMDQLKSGDDNSSNGQLQIDLLELEDISWNIYGEYIGFTEALIVNNFQLTQGVIDVEQLKLINGNSTTGGVLDTEFGLHELSCSVEYDETIEIDIDTFIADSLMLSGVVRYNDQPSFELHIITYPSHFRPNPNRTRKCNGTNFI